MCAVLAVLWVTGGFLDSKPFDGPTYTVKKEILKITIVARGSLEAVNNRDIICDVRSGQKGSTFATTIKEVIDAGSEVKKGQIIMRLDDSGFDNSLQEQEIKVQNATMEKAKAKSELSIIQTDNKVDILKAETALMVAELEYKKYVDGDFPWALMDVKGRIDMATSDYGSWFDFAQNSFRMAKAGFITPVRADADQMRMQSSLFALNKVMGELNVLENYTKPKIEAELKAKWEEAKLNLDKAKQQGESKLETAEATLSAKEAQLVVEERKKRDYETMKEHCTIRSPQDGMVVYYVAEQTRMGGGTQQGIIAQGEPVREMQKLLQIPDLSKMQVSVRVPEALVSNLHSDDTSDEMPGQNAHIRIDAFPTREFTGKVKFVDTVAAQADWFASDVKYYKTIVTLDQNMEGLKPGMSAEVTIFADESPSAVLTIPVQAVLGTISMGAKRQCFVASANGRTEMRDIVVGMSNERFVEVKSGLTEGEKIVLDPRTLVKEGSDLKPGRVRSKPSDAEEPNEPGTTETKKKDAKKADGATPPVKLGAPGGAKIGQAPDPKMVDAFVTKMRDISPDERREWLNSNIPDAAMRDQAIQMLRGKGIDIPDGIR